MSSNFSANQYEGAFKSQRLQNWCQPKHFKESPDVQVGHTSFIADDNGHLLPGVVRRGGAWPDFKGTWELPARIPAGRLDPTARSAEGLNRLRTWGLWPETGGAQPIREGRSSGQSQTGGDEQPDGAHGTPPPTGRGSGGGGRADSHSPPGPQS
ncbi:protein Flattop isoform 1-T3 [Menidia menidia]